MTSEQVATTAAETADPALAGLSFDEAFAQLKTAVAELEGCSGRPAPGARRPRRPQAGCCG